MSISIGDIVMLTSAWHDVVTPEAAVTAIVIGKDDSTCPARLTVLLGGRSIVCAYEDEVAILK